MADSVILETNKVSRSGDTMTGTLKVQGDGDVADIITKDTLYGYGNLPSSDTYRWLLYKDASDVTIGAVYTRLHSDGATDINIRARARVNNANVDNTLYLRSNADGTLSVGVSDPSVWRTALNVVNKSGDTITGLLSLARQSDDYGLIMKAYSDKKTVTPSSNAVPTGIVFRDSTDSAYGSVRVRHYTSGNYGIELQAITPDGNTGNTLSILINSSGTRKIEVSDAAAWRSALGLGTDGALPITIAQGGSGQTSVSTVSTISTIVTAGSGFRVDSATFKKWGKIGMCEIGYTCTTAQTTTSAHTVFNLKSGYRPALVWCGVDNSQQYCIINTDGNCTIYRAIAANAYVVVRATFLLP